MDIVTLPNTLLGVYRTILASKSCLYVAAAMNTGARYYSFLDKHQGKDPELLRVLHYEEVFRPNVQDARKRVTQGRNLGPAAVPVIDPTSLGRVPRWVAEDYYRFWAEVFSLAVRTVWLPADWAMSTGCVLEAITALKLGLVIWMSRGQWEASPSGEGDWVYFLSPAYRSPRKAQLVGKLAATIKELKGRGHSVPRLEQELANMEAL